MALGVFLASHRHPAAGRALRHHQVVSNSVSTCSLGHNWPKGSSAQLPCAPPAPSAPGSHPVPASFVCCFSDTPAVLLMLGDIYIPSINYNYLLSQINKPNFFLLPTHRFEARGCLILMVAPPKTSHLALSSPPLPPSPPKLPILSSPLPAARILGWCYFCP